MQYNEDEDVDVKQQIINYLGQLSRNVTTNKHCLEVYPQILYSQPVLYDV